MLVELKLTSVTMVKWKYKKKKKKTNFNKCNSLYIHFVCALTCGDLLYCEVIFIFSDLHQRKHEQTCLILIKHAVCDTSVLSWLLVLSIILSKAV